MFIDRDKVRNDLFGRVGFELPTNPNYPGLLPSLLESRSNRTFNNAHPLLTPENIDQTIKNFSQYNYPLFSTATRDNGGYTTGSKVSFGTKNYEYLLSTPSNSLTPNPPDAATWREIDELSDYLIKSVFAGIDEMLDDWINDKKIRAKIKSIFDKIALFSGVANYRNLERNKDHMVGLRIRFKRGEKSIAAIINRLGHHFNKGFTAAGGPGLETGTLKIYLYHSSQQQPLFSFDLEHAKPNSSIWTPWDTDNNILRYLDESYDAGGDFFIAYKQSELEALNGTQALRMDVNWSNPCLSCGGSRFSEFYKQYSPFLDIIGFEIDESELGPNDEIFNPDNVGISATNNYGLNLNLSSRCDIGYLFTEDEYLVDEAMQLAVGRVLMRGLAYNTRKGNSLGNQVRAEAKKELFNHKEAFGTLQDRYMKSIKGLSFDLSGLGDTCFPCDDGYDDVIISTMTLR